MTKDNKNQKLSGNKDTVIDGYTLLCAGEKLELLKNFLLEHFDYDELKKVGFYDKTIKRKDYQKQADRICKFFGYESVYQYGFKTTYAHISYAEGHRPEGEPFLTEFKAWHED